MPPRDFSPGMGEAVAKRTITRPGETWADVARRVSIGNAYITDGHDATMLNRHLASGTILLSGRHLQHGDPDQKHRNIEVFTNCATSATSFTLFYLLLNGSGVGRSYDDAMMVVDWSKQPIIVPVIDSQHKDVLSGEISALTREQAAHLYAYHKIDILEVPDSREGWAQAVERMETEAFKKKTNKVLLLDFSQVRPRGSPIGGMQNRPASGPGPLITAINNITRLRNVDMPLWRQTMFVDHYLAECVLVGGARRAARIATKTWTDPDIQEFINIKSHGGLWSANNSITVDRSFWGNSNTTLEAILRAQYYDRTGEPGIINEDLLEGAFEGTDAFEVSSDKYTLSDPGRELFQALTARFNHTKHKQIVNPCSEITLSKLGGYCVIGDIAPYHAKNEQELQQAVRYAVRALIRTNLLPAFYASEVERTNRIGISLTGIHEYAWAAFRLTWNDLLDEHRSCEFWNTLDILRRIAIEEADAYSEELGLNPPRTVTTIKPAGTTSKLFGLTEGAHLPAMREYIRWVQFRNDDPLVDEYRKKGYPTKTLRIYKGHTVVGFPTKPEICNTDNPDIVTASEASLEDQFKYLQLLEKYWLGPDRGNQISFTAKYDPSKLSFEEYKRIVTKYQPLVRCCSLMPVIDTTAYEYQPEEPVTLHQYEAIIEQINRTEEDVGREHVDCDNGACPIEFRG